ncbi:MAG TPA: hypothetical protein VLJ11_20870 [Bryobacteraceae bacterium]|nr:hypothetical protein [Bryobacteraceae bacterium]
MNLNQLTIMVATIAAPLPFQPAKNLSTMSCQQLAVKLKTETIRFLDRAGTAQPGKLAEQPTGRASVHQPVLNASLV